MIAIESLQALKEYVGKEIGVSDWVAVGQDRISAFADITGDRQWIHTDVKRARMESPFHSTIAHGFLTLSLLSSLMQQAFQVRGSGTSINYGLNRVRFPAPVPAGSQIRGRFKLLALDDLQGSHRATYGCTMECKGSVKPCCVAEWIVRYYP